MEIASIRLAMDSSSKWSRPVLPGLLRAVTLISKHTNPAGERGRRKAEVRRLKAEGKAEGEMLKVEG
jgi:hypothetical protein